MKTKFFVVYKGDPLDPTLVAQGCESFDDVHRCSEFYNRQKRHGYTVEVFFGGLSTYFQSIPENERPAAIIEKRAHGASMLFDDVCGYFEEGYRQGAKWILEQMGCPL